MRRLLLITVQVTSKKLIVPHAMLSSHAPLRLRVLLLGTIDFPEIFSEDPSMQQRKVQRGV